ncbi:MAG: NADH-quinone oxidoreductase subunit J [Haloarculaceae archaeon]
MTTRPRLETNKRQAVGLLAFALFAVLAAVFLAADLGSVQGFPGEGSITASIGYAMFNLDGGAFPAEGFLVAFILIAVVLDAALDAAVMLATREEEGGRFLPLRADGSGDGESGREDADRGGDR